VRGWVCVLGSNPRHWPSQSKVKWQGPIPPPPPNTTTTTTTNNPPPHPPIHPSIQHQQGEIETMLQLGVPPSSIIYANPCKPPQHIAYARDHGVHLMTFDNADELAKARG
jgi:hypothetical protein